MALTPEQRDVVRRTIRRSNKRKASPRERKAALLAEGVESNYNDDLTAAESDRDSSGALQQRPSQGWGPHSDTLETDVDQFLEAARKINRKGFKGSAGQLAQAVQRSAFPGRYDERSGEVEALLNQVGGVDDDGEPETTTRKVTTPGVDRSPERRALMLAYLGQRGRPDALLDLKAGLDENRDTPSRTRTVTERTERKSSSSRPSGDGPRGAHGEIKELFYNGPGGVNADEGRRVQSGFVSGHTDHVHVAAGPKRIKQIARFAQRMGLTVRELEPFDKVDPVHTDGSFHYRKQAADISGDPELMAKFSRSIAKRFNLK